MYQRFFYGKRHELCLHPIVLGVIFAAIYAVSFLILDQPLAKFVRTDVPENFIVAVKLFIRITIQVSPLPLLFLFRQYKMSKSLNGAHRNRIMILVTSFIVAIIFVILLKLIFGRSGPSDYLTVGTYGFHYFQGKLAVSSFPSVFCAGAGAAAATFWVIAPSYRLTIILLSLLGLCSQVATEAVFLSDGLAGFAVGIIVFAGLKKLFDACGTVLAESE